MNSSSISSISDCNKCQWIPLLTPALKEDSCEVDRSLSTSRANKITLIAITAMVSTLILSLTFIPNAIIAAPIFLLVMGIIPLDIWLTARAANKIAVNEYLYKNFPSQSATNLIQHNFKAAQLLIKNNGNVNKLNENLQTLLDGTPNLDVFKLLINSGADVKILDNRRTSYFQKFVENKNPVYLEYILKNNLIKCDDFDSTKQVKLWTKLGSSKAGELLKKHGFDVNVRDNQGYTPLLRMAEEASRRVRSSYTLSSKKLSIFNHITTLLNCGADRTMTITVDDVEKNAMQLTTNPAIKDLLKQT